MVNARCCRRAGVFSNTAAEVAVVLGTKDEEDFILRPDTRPSDYLFIILILIALISVVERSGS
jgi:hypothetical protein